MKVLFISHHRYPHIGGVEKHIYELENLFSQNNINVKTISEEDIKQPHVKIVGLFYIWYWLFKNINLIKGSDIIHIHDVFIWYLPFRFIFPKKKVYITFHGWEGTYPIPFWNILNKRVANYLCNGSIAVGKYIEKYFGIKTKYIIHGAAHKQKDKLNKIKGMLVYLGRQDADTGINELKNWLKTSDKNLKVKYITNDPNPEKYLRTAEYCVPSGYLSYLEARSMGCEIITFACNPLKEDYWNEIKQLKTIPSWDDVADTYLRLWSIQ